MKIQKDRCDTTNVYVVASSRLIGDSLARLLTALDRSIVAWSAPPAPVPSDNARPEPHVVVLEVAELDRVVAGAEAIRNRWPHARLVLVVRDESATAHQLASDVGASGCVGSRRGPAALARAVLGPAGDGGRTAGQGAEPAQRRQAPASDVERALSRLTRREEEVLRMLVAGRSADVMAATLGVSPNTLRSHLQAVLSKLGVHSRLQAAAVAHRAGLGGDRAWSSDNGSTTTASGAPQ